MFEILLNCSLKYKEGKKYKIPIKGDNSDKSIRIGDKKIIINSNTKWSTIKRLIDEEVEKYNLPCNVCGGKFCDYDGMNIKVNCPSCNQAICSGCFLSKFEFNSGIIKCNNCNFIKGKKLNSSQIADGLEEIRMKIQSQILN